MGSQIGVDQMVHIGTILKDPFFRPGPEKPSSQIRRLTKLTLAKF